MGSFQTFIILSIAIIYQSFDSQSSPVTQASKKISSVKEEVHGIDKEFANSLASSLTRQQCLRMYIFFTSVKPDKNNTPSLLYSMTMDDILAAESELRIGAEFPTWIYFGRKRKECLKAIKDIMTRIRQDKIIESDSELKLVVLDGLGLVNRTDLADKIVSIYNQRKHEEMEVILGEIKRHGGSQNQTRYWHDADYVNDDKFKYEIIVCILIGTVIIVIIVAKSLRSFQARAAIIPNS